MNVIDDPIAQWIMDELGLDFHTSTNQELRPSEAVDVLAAPAAPAILKTHWGLTADWTSQLIINAKSETITNKPIFAQAYATQRCLVPCMGWYEWQQQGPRHKQKYLIGHAEGRPMLMAGIFTLGEQGPRLATLTKTAEASCAEVHARMPVLVEPTNAQQWFSAKPQDYNALLGAYNSEALRVTTVGKGDPQLSLF